MTNSCSDKVVRAIELLLLQARVSNIVSIDIAYEDTTGAKVSVRESLTADTVPLHSEPFE